MFFDMELNRFKLYLSLSTKIHLYEWLLTLKNWSSKTWNKKYHSFSSKTNKTKNIQSQQQSKENMLSNIQKEKY